jgi:hypothetical protein
MSENKLLDRLSSYLDLGAKHRKKKADELVEVIHKIKKKEKALAAECRKVGKGKKCDMLKKRIAVLHAQRKKGLKALKKIRQE